MAPKAAVILDNGLRFKGQIKARSIKVSGNVVFVPHGSTTTLTKSVNLVDTEDKYDEAIAMNSLPTEFVLQENYLNPFNPSTTITFVVPKTTEIDLAIYHIKGQLVRTLVSGAVTAGLYKVVWDSKDEDGLGVACGVYLYRLKARDFVVEKKLLLAK